MPRLPFFGAFGNELTAANDCELRRLLAQVDLAVPPRTEGRGTDHRECYTVVHYLRVLQEHDLLRFPFRLTKRERPDFEIEMGAERLGLEVAEAGSAKHQEQLYQMAKADQGSVLERNRLAAAGEGFRALPFSGDEPERLWTREVLPAIREKTRLLGSYSKFPEQHLLLYDNTEHGPLTTWSVTELPGRLAAAIRDWNVSEPDLGRRFDRISVLRDRVLLFDVTGSALLLPVPPSASQPQLLPLARLGVAEEPLHDFCQRHHIRKLGFFGSAREERFGPESDVDVLVEFEPTERIGLLGLAKLELELTRLLGRKADLRTVPELSRYFRDEVVREKTDLAYVAG